MALSLVAKRNLAWRTNFLQFARTYAKIYNNHDWRPAQFPKTEEERIAAAKKYNLIPADYQPYPDNGFGIGDYPLIETVSEDARNQQQLWDNPELVRNYGEVVHENYDWQNQKFDPNYKYHQSHTAMLLQFIAAMGVFGWLALSNNGGFHIDFIRRLPPHEPGTDQVFHSFELVPINHDAEKKEKC